MLTSIFLGEHTDLIGKFAEMKVYVGMIAKDGTIDVTVFAYDKESIIPFQREFNNIKYRNTAQSMSSYTITLEDSETLSVVIQKLQYCYDALVVTRT